MSNNSTDLTTQGMADAQALNVAIADLIRGKDVRVAFVALFASIDEASKQGELEIRKKCVEYLRGLADELDAMNAPKH